MEWIAVGGSAWEGYYFDTVIAFWPAAAATAMAYWVGRQAIWLGETAITIRRARETRTVALGDVHSVMPGRITHELAIHVRGHGLMTVPAQWFAPDARNAVLDRLDQVAGHASPAVDQIVPRRSMTATVAALVVLTVLIQVGQMLAWQMADAFNIADLAIGTVLLAAAFVRGHGSAQIDGEGLTLRRPWRHHCIPLAEVRHATVVQATGAPFVYLVFPFWLTPTIASLVLLLWRRPGVVIEARGKRHFIPAIGAPAGAADGFAHALRRRAGLDDSPRGSPSGHEATGLGKPGNAPVGLPPFPPIHVKGRRLVLVLLLVYVLGALFTSAMAFADGAAHAQGLALMVAVMIAAWVLLAVDPGTPSGVPGALRIAGHGSIRYDAVLNATMATRFGQPVVRIDARGRSTPLYIPVMMRDATAMSDLLTRLHGVAYENKTRPAPPTPPAPPTLRMRGALRVWMVLALSPMVGLVAAGFWNGLQGEAIGWVLAALALLMSVPVAYLVAGSPSNVHQSGKALRIGRAEIALADISAVWVTPGWPGRRVVVQSIRHPAPFAIDTSLRRTADVDRFTEALIATARANVARGVEPPVVRASALPGWFGWGLPAALATLVALGAARVLRASAEMARWSTTAAVGFAVGTFFFALIGRLGCGVGPRAVAYRDRLGRWRRVPLEGIRRVVPPRTPEPMSHPDVYAHHPRIGLAGRRPWAGTIVLEMDDGRRVPIRPAPDLAANAPVLALAIASAVEHRRSVDDAASPPDDDAPADARTGTDPA